MRYVCIEWLLYHFNEANCSIVAAANESLQRGSARFHAGLQGNQLATRAGPVFHLHPGSGGMSPFEHLHLWESQTRVEQSRGCTPLLSEIKGSSLRAAVAFN